jgi:hypothetical protein
MGDAMTVRYFPMSETVPEPERREQTQQLVLRHHRKNLVTTGWWETDRAENGRAHCHRHGATRQIQS